MKVKTLKDLEKLPRGTFLVYRRGNQVKMSGILLSKLKLKTNQYIRCEARFFIFSYLGTRQVLLNTKDLKYSEFYPK